MADRTFHPGNDLHRRSKRLLMVQTVHDLVNENLKIRIGEVVSCSQYAFDVTHSRVLLTRLL